MVNMRFRLYLCLFLISTQESKYFTCCSFRVDFECFILQILHENRHFSKIRAVFSDSYDSESISDIRSSAEDTHDLILIDAFIKNTLSDAEFHDTLLIWTCSRINLFAIVFFHNQGVAQVHADE